MRDRMLHDSLWEVALESAHALGEIVERGEEVPFEVASAGDRRGRGAALYAYRPLTGDFIAAHTERLRRLDGFEHAAVNLARTRGAPAYLRSRGEGPLEVSELTQARLGVLAFLAALWDGADGFDLTRGRFGDAYGELESVVLAARLVTTAFVPVHGVVVDCGPVDLGDGVELLPADRLDPECDDLFAAAETQGDSYLAVSIDAPSDASLPFAEIRGTARNVLSALRLFRPGGVALGLSGQANVGGYWRPIALSFSGRAVAGTWNVIDGEQDELRKFLSAIRRVDRRHRVAWALMRFEMGLERRVPVEGLSDLLLGLRALVDAHDDAGRAALPARVAALCARAPERAHVRRTVELAFALEHLAMGRVVGKRDRADLERIAPLNVIAGVEAHLRALLHDLVCGYLSPNLKDVADEILLADGAASATGSGGGAGVAGVDAADARYEAPAARSFEVVPPPPAAPAPAATNAESTDSLEVLFGETAEIAALDLRNADADADAVDLADGVSYYGPGGPIEPDWGDGDYDDDDDATGSATTANVGDTLDFAFDLTLREDADVRAALAGMAAELLPTGDDSPSDDPHPDFTDGYHDLSAEPGPQVADRVDGEEVGWEADSEPSLRRFDRPRLVPRDDPDSPPAGFDDSIPAWEDAAPPPAPLRRFIRRDNDPDIPA